MTNKKLWSIATLTIVAASCRASVMVSGFATIEGGPYVSFSNSGEGSVSGSCVTFNPDNSSITSSASASASQSLNAGPHGFSFSQAFQCNWSPPNPFEPDNPDGLAGVGVTMDIGLSFVLLTPVDYQFILFADGGGGNPGYVQSFELNGVDAFSFSSGTLLPGSYSFTGFQSYYTIDALPGAAVAEANGELTFSPHVPDTGSTLFLFGFASLGLLVIKSFTSVKEGK